MCQFLDFHLKHQADSEGGGINTNSITTYVRRKNRIKRTNMGMQQITQMKQVKNTNGDSDQVKEHITGGTFN